MNEEQMKAQTKEFEGYRDVIYVDSTGKRTLGFGHRASIGSKVPLEIAEMFFDLDWKEACDDFIALKYQFQIDVNSTREYILTDMLYNMGYGEVCDFKKMLRAIWRSDYQIAADEMVSSLWYNQTGNRAKKLVQMMRTGQCVES